MCMYSCQLLQDVGSQSSSIKAKRPEKFTQIALFRKVLYIIESHTYRLPVRRFVIDLFDKNVMRHFVLEDEVDDDSDAQSQ